MLALEQPSQIVLLGAGGFLGYAISRYFERLGFSVLCISRSYQWPESLNSGRVTRICSLASDVNNYLLYVRDNACLIYMAGSTNILLAENQGVCDIAKHLEEITEALTSILLKKALFKCFLISSGGTVYGECPLAGCDEKSELKPKSIYGLRNVLIEQSFRFLCRKNSTPYDILRITNPYGYQQIEVQRKGLVVALILSALNGNEVILRGNGEQRRDYINCEDLCQMLHDIMLLSTAKGATINIASGKSHRSIDIASIVSRITNSTPNIVVINDEPDFEVHSSIVKRTSSFYTKVRPTGLEKNIKKIWERLLGISH
jgi:UDP-glucose 4-epimerase